MMCFFLGNIFTSFQATFFNQVIISFCITVIRIKKICKYNSILCHFYVYHCVASIYHIIMHFLKKYVRIKILVLINKLSPKLDEINACCACKYNSYLPISLSLYRPPTSSHENIRKTEIKFFFPISYFEITLLLTFI